MPYETVERCNCALCRSRSDNDREYEYDDDDSYDDDYDYERVIQRHGYRPEVLEFRGRGPVYLGMELEVNAPTGRYGRLAARVQEDLGDVCWLQEDGSISCGFEITTHPMSYRWAIKYFPWDVLDRMTELGFYTSRDVGLHVHVSRAAFTSECHLYRWMKFIYRNAVQVQNLARRRNSEWASFDPHFRQSVRKYMKGHDPYEMDTRYQAVNPLNRDTLEVRVFASSLEPREVKAALAFVASTVEYTRDLDANRIIKERGWAWSTYVEWLRAPERDVYRPILDELEALPCVS